MAVIASLGDLAGAYALPALFVLLLAGKAAAAGGGRGHDSSPPPLLGKAEATFCRFLVPGSLLLSAAGMVLSVKSLLDDMEKAEKGGEEAAVAAAVGGLMRWWR